MSHKSNGRKSLLDNTRNSNFLRKSFGGHIETDTLSLKDYGKSLKKEIAQWKEILKIKKKRAGITLKPLVWKQEDILCLDEANRNYLSLSPNYTEIVKKANTYVASLLIMDALFKEREDSAESLLKKLDIERESILLELIDEVACVICNDGICTKDIHNLASRADEYCPPLSIHFIDATR